MLQESRYSSYLLRLWMSEENGRPIWRASLESTHTGQRRNFSDVRVLVEFLETEFDSRQTEPSGQPQSRRIS